MSADLEQLRYPVGRFAMPESITPTDLQDWVDYLAGFPVLLRKAVSGWTDTQLDTPYRTEGWTVRQLVHHLADSHMNAFIRVKLAISEDNPTIKAYDQDGWAAQNDAVSAPVEWSLAMIDGIHARWAYLARASQAWDRTFVHPEYKKVYRIDQMTALYHWHSRHHLAQIMGLQERMGW